MSGGKGGGSDAVNAITQQSTELDPRQDAALGNLLTQAQNRGNVPMSFFPGSTLAGEQALTREGQQSLLTSGQDIGGMASAGRQALQDDLNIDVVGDPRTKAMVDAAIAPLEDQFSNRVLPSISSGAQGAGAFGGTRADLMKAEAGREFGRAVGETSAGLYSDAFRTGLDQRSRALSQMPMMAQLGMMPGQIQQEVGAQRQGRQQQEIDAARERFEFNQFEPENRLDRLFGRVTALNFPGTTQAGSLYGKDAAELLSGLFGGQFGSIGSFGGTGGIGDAGSSHGWSNRFRGSR